MCRICDLKFTKRKQKISWSAGGVIGQDTQELLHGMPMKRYFDSLVRIVAHTTFHWNIIVVFHPFHGPHIQL